MTPEEQAKVDKFIKTNGATGCPAMGSEELRKRNEELTRNADNFNYKSIQAKRRRALKAIE